MGRILIAGMIVLLSGCATQNYSYVAQSNADPEIVFGSPTKFVESRQFLVNIKGATSNKCEEFTMAGDVGKNGFGGGDETAVIRTPAGQAIAISSGYSNSTVSCHPPVFMFLPQNGKRYSVDILYDSLHGSSNCFLSIIEVGDNGNQKKITNLTKLPECVK